MLQSSPGQGKEEIQTEAEVFLLSVVTPIVKDFRDFDHSLHLSTCGYKLKFEKQTVHSYNLTSLASLSFPLPFLLQKEIKSPVHITDIQSLRLGWRKVH